MNILGTLWFYIKEFYVENYAIYSSLYRLVLLARLYHKVNNAINKFATLRHIYLDFVFVFRLVHSCVCVPCYLIWIRIALKFISLKVSKKGILKNSSKPFFFNCKSSIYENLIKNIIKIKILEDPVIGFEYRKPSLRVPWGIRI